MGASKPIIADRPVVGHPPLFVKFKRASLALDRGAITQSGMMMAKKPRTCRIRTRPSGESLLAESTGDGCPSTNRSVEDARQGQC